MSADQELKNAQELLLKIYKDSRDIILIPTYESVRLQDQFQLHVEKMVCFLRKGAFTGYRFEIHIPIRESTAKDEYERACKALNDLYLLCLDSNNQNTYDIRFLQAKVAAHMKNMVHIWNRLQEKKYFERMTRTSWDSEEDSL